MSTFKYKSNLQEVLSKIADNKSNAINEIGIDLSGKVSQKAPVDTGELRDSVGYEVEGDEAIIGATAKHAPHIELGTSKAPAQPFLEGTVMDNVGTIEKIINENMSKM